MSIRGRYRGKGGAREYARPTLPDFNNLDQRRSKALIKYAVPGSREFFPQNENGSRGANVGFRRSKTDVDEKQAWDSFVSAHIDLINHIGLSLEIVQSRERWIDFLMHGCLSGHRDPMHFHSWGLDENRKRQLIELIAGYFEVWGNHFDPMALDHQVFWNELRHRLGLPNIGVSPD